MTTPGCDGCSSHSDKYADIAQLLQTAVETKEWLQVYRALGLAVDAARDASAAAVLIRLRRGGKDWNP